MSQIDNIRNGLARLASTVETIANAEAAELPPATVNSISGNAIHGGKITLLRSTGVRDNATRTSLLVEDDFITVGSVDTDNLIGDIDVSGNLNVQGKLTAGTLHVEELSSTQKVTQNIDFHAQAGSLDMMGMQWRKQGEATKQIVWREDRFYVSSTVDLHRNAQLQIDNIPVLSADRLGVTIKHSELEHVGTLNNLRTSGDLNIDDFVTWDSGMMRFGIGVEAANAQFSVASNEAEFVVDPEFDHVRVGAYTTRIVEEEGQAQILTANNVCAHIDDLSSVVGAVATLLAPDACAAPVGSAKSTAAAIVIFLNIWLRPLSLGVSTPRPV